MANRIIRGFARGSCGGLRPRPPSWPWRGRLRSPKTDDLNPCGNSHALRVRPPSQFDNLATILYVLPCAFGSGFCGGRTRPQGHRKQIALEPRCNF
jgi:hypothetical protein